MGLIRSTWPGSVIVAAGLLALGAAARPAFADEAAEMRLLGFEAAEMKAWADRKVARHWGFKELESGEGFQFRLSYGLWYTARRGDATEGRHALVRSCTRAADFWANWGRLTAKPHVLHPRRRDPVHYRSGHVFKTFEFFRTVFPRDWLAYDRLAIDVKSTQTDVTLAVLLEDDGIEPPLDRAFAVPAGEWVTVSFDLARAARDGQLDTTRMANIYVLLDKIGGPTDVLLDNIRLVKGNARGEWPVLEDRSPWREPFKEPGPATPRPVTINGAPETSRIRPIGATLIDVSKVRLSYTRFSQNLHSLAAFDNRFMVLEGSLGRGSAALFTSDGGVTWKGLDDGPKATTMGWGHQNTRHLYVDDHGGLMGIFILMCAGGKNPSDIYFHRVAFTGRTWTVSPFALVDVDVRHCPERFALLRLSNGAMWAAWDHLSRREGTRLRLKVSDDDGQTWRTPAGTELLHRQPIRLGGGPALVPYGPTGLACVWVPKDRHLYWSRTEDGKTWTEPQQVMHGR